jgi:hypothetical protein
MDFLIQPMDGISWPHLIDLGCTHNEVAGCGCNMVAGCSC